MATNSGRGNPIAAEDGPNPQNTPPALSDDTKKDIAKAAKGTHAKGSDAKAPVVSAPGNPTDAFAPAPAEGSAKVKTEKELEKERKKKEKQAKFEEKQKAKVAQASAPAQPKNKEKKGKPKPAEEPVPPYVEDTPPGEKKRLRPFDDPNFKAYDPVAIESAWYEWWEKEGFFQPQFTKDGKVRPEGSFVIVHPPPNVTGALHMGHALGDSLQDLLVRWNRMLGKTTLWLPGCDHAGISTQSVVETMLWRRHQQTRHDLGREKFIDTVMDWKDEYHKRINNALRKMGGSFDWTREAFTMDPNLSKAVAETFVRLHDEGIIYRANRLVNWCTKLNTALSNLEVSNKELTGRTLLSVPGYDKKVEFGIIVHFKYRIKGSDETIEIATTRPETMLGDTGIAVHPEDPRYQHLIGKAAEHPFIEDRELPIIADEYVDREFGTGAVKITPAHDPNDFALGQKHKLKFINILTDDGLMNENAGPYKGQRRFDVRYTIQDDLKKLGLYVDKKDNAMKVPLCEKSKDVIEPVMKPQWYVRVGDMAAAAVKAVQDGEILIRPESSEKSFYRWMENINDWCISRQLWWGHQCPVYFANVEGETGDPGDDKLWFAGRTEEEARQKAEKALPGKKFTLERDGDVLDTWFSSGLWPFSTLGWPEKTHDLETLYPTSVLETGWDILFFWIARMVMLGIKLTGKVPFREVYCHTLVRDSDGRKMSKSLGNVIDPLDVISGIKLDDLHAKLKQGNLPPGEIEQATKYQRAAFPAGIPECGADALRFCMVSYTTGGGDINFDIKVMHAYRKFCNKIYQASKYVLGKLEAEKGFVPRSAGERSVGASQRSLAEKWILHKMNAAARDINEALEAREFARSTTIVYQYWYGCLCDVFIENSKALIADGDEAARKSAIETLYTALEAALLMIHPFMPFITEELWQRLPRRPGDETPSIVVARYPVYDEKLDDPAAEEAYELVMGLSKGIRSLMSQYALKDEGKVYIQCFSDVASSTAAAELASIKSLAGKGVEAVELLPPSASRPSGCVTFPVSSQAAVYLRVVGRVDLAAEVARAEKKLSDASAERTKKEKQTRDPAWLAKAPAEQQEAEMKKLEDLKGEERAFEGTIAQLKALQLEE